MKDHINIIGLPPAKADAIKDALIIKAAHQAGEHREQTVEACPSCARTRDLARDWAMTQPDIPDDTSIDEVVRRYRHYAEKMSQS